MRRFPFGLTVATAVGLAILVSLGVWQLHRLSWKQHLLTQIAALDHAPAQAIGPVLARGRAGADVDFTRVDADCAQPAGPSPTAFRYALRDGQIGWRLIGVCRIAGAPFDGVLIDRGLAERFSGAMAPAAATFAEPGAITGILRAVAAKGPFDTPPTTDPGGLTVIRAFDRQALQSLARRVGLRAPAPWLLVVESERPKLAGVTPAPLPSDIPNNHFSYALTWFGLAGALTCIYAARLWQWRKVR